MKGTGYNTVCEQQLAEKRIVMEQNKQKNECKCDADKHIKGIMCNVEHCAYHNGKNECYAGCICVGPCNAESSADTVCATFKPKEF